MPASASSPTPPELGFLPAATGRPVAAIAIDIFAPAIPPGRIGTGTTRGSGFPISPPRIVPASARRTGSGVSPSVFVFPAAATAAAAAAAAGRGFPPVIVRRAAVTFSGRSSVDIVSPGTATVEPISTLGYGSIKATAWNNEKIHFKAFRLVMIRRSSYLCLFPLPRSHRILHLR